MRLMPLRVRSPVIATAFLLLPLVVLWFLPRVFTLTADWPESAPRFMLGWIACAFVLTNCASIMWTAAQSSFARAFMGYALFVDFVALLLLVLSLATGSLSFMDVFRVYLLLAAWSAIWTALTFLIGRSVLAPAITIALSSLLFAAPVAAVPLVQFSTTAAPHLRESVLDAIAYATPMLPAFDALKSVLPAASWPEWNLMYRLTPIAQEIGLRVRWHTGALIYAGIAILLMLTYLMTRTRVR